MSTRIPLPYSGKVIKLFRNPKNLGRMENATVYATAGSPACGDMITLYLRIEDGKILNATFESYGCAANIAAASVLTEMIKGKKVEEAWKITWRKISDELGGLPSIKYHCGILAVGSLRRAIRKYYGDKRPSWLPKETTSEEKLALKEEELIKRFLKRSKKELNEKHF